MLGVCYYPEHWPKEMWAQDAKEMRELGIEYVRLAEFAWCRLEPGEGLYDFDWLDEAISVLSSEGLKIVLCTPTATPPKWLIDKYPSILPTDIHTGNVRGFGSRRHYDFSSEEYFKAAMSISERMAIHYANHPAIVGWQTDNELACHDTTHSGSENAKRAFQEWCTNRYKDVKSLNDSWGTIFWSMEYNDFCDIELPILAVTETHPSHQLAYRRFSSDQVIKFHNAMVKVLRQHCPNHFITHNFIPMVDTQCDNFALADPLDFASYDNYPLGRTDLFFSKESTEAFKRYMRTGHPDYSSYCFDQIRGISKAPFWIMEQQPGPVNWAHHNPKPANGMIALWSCEAIAHGAAVVSYFRWRQAAFAQEQMHAGLKRVDNSKSDAWNEILQFKKDMDELGINLTSGVNAPVAIVMDAHNQWVTEIERQGDSYEHQEVEFSYYSALRQLGLEVDFVSQSDDLSKYNLVVAPCLPIVQDEFITRCNQSKAHVVLGPRSGAKTDEFWLTPTLGPGKLQQLIDIKIINTETLRPDCINHIQFNDSELHGNKWCEYFDQTSLETVDIIGTYESGEAAIVQNTKATYVGSLLPIDDLIELLSSVTKTIGLPTIKMPTDVRICRRDNTMFLFNYSEKAKTVSLSVGEEKTAVEVPPRTYKIQKL